MSNKKKRLSMLDQLASAAAPAPAPETKSAPTQNRALAAARSAVDGHHVWDLDPDLIDDERPADRLDRADIDDLRDSIEQSGQTVPILVRRHPQVPDRYLLVYGRRRLEAVRASNAVDKVRALIATLDERSAVQAQISENIARRDLTYIEKSLFSKELMDTGFGTQSEVAEVLTVTKSSVSMALAVVEAVGRDLAEAIGPAQGVGRPRWDELAKSIVEYGVQTADLIEVAERTWTRVQTDFVADPSRVPPDASVAAFDAVMREVADRAPKTPLPSSRKTGSVRARTLSVGGRRIGSVQRSKSGLRLEIADSDFADWLNSQASSVIQELHMRWKNRSEDDGNEQ